jgi:hypothetical protein
MHVAEELEAGLAAVGAVLLDRGLRVEVAIVGGGGLAILGLVRRATKDIDIVGIFHEDALVSAQPLPAALGEAVAEVARSLDWKADWMNGGPSSLLHLGLPQGFLDRTERRDYGGLAARFASRFDQIHLKLYAAVDDRPGGKHHTDLIALQPSATELRAAAAWARTHDASEGFATMLRQVLATFGVDDGEAV